MKCECRKKFRSELLRNFPSISEEQLQEFMPNKETISAVRIFTHTGESVLMYCIQKLPIVFEIEKIFYPSVYMLWKFPMLLYAFTTHPQVFPRIAGGADLMLPGVILKDGFNVKAYGKLEKGDRVSVNLSNNKAPIAVGRAALSSMDMYMSAKRGKAAYILHYVGDELWSYGTKLSIPNLGPPEGFMDVCDDAELESDLHESCDGAMGSDTASAVSVMTELTETLSMLSENSVSSHSMKELDDGSVCSQSDGQVVSEDSELHADIPTLSEDSKEVMDELAKYCFLKALNTTAKKADYPMLTSKFYKLHMLPSTPLGKSIDMKRSSYKKLSVFLNEMNSLDVIKVKELTKGVESIMSVNGNHPLIKGFVDSESSLEDLSVSHQVESHCRPEITEMFIITAAVLPLFSKFDLKKGMSLQATEVRKYLTDYVRKEQLQDAVNRRMVRLDAVLLGALEKKCDANTNALSWDELITKFLSCMTHSYHMAFSGRSGVLTKGKLEPIDIQVGKRTGNKKVTLINNLELFGIILTEFARECQHGVAASTSISMVPGRKSAQLMVQGNQVLFVGNLLMDKYQIPKRYIRGLENAPKPKK